MDTTRRPGEASFDMRPEAGTSGPQSAPGVEDLVTDDDRLTPATEFTSQECDDPLPNVGVSPPSAEAACPDWEHLGG